MTTDPTLPPRTLSDEQARQVLSILGYGCTRASTGDSTRPNGQSAEAIDAEDW